jgi:hypothetical protein
VSINSKDGDETYVGPRPADRRILYIVRTIIAPGIPFNIDSRSVQLEIYCLLSKRTGGILKREININDGWVIWKFETAWLTYQLT